MTLIVGSSFTSGAPKCILSLLTWLHGQSGRGLTPIGGIPFFGRWDSSHVEKKPNARAKQKSIMTLPFQPVSWEKGFHTVKFTGQFDHKEQGWDSDSTKPGTNLFGPQEMNLVIAGNSFRWRMWEDYLNKNFIGDCMETFLIKFTVNYSKSNEICCRLEVWIIASLVAW